jgi:hypothetical protein
LFPAGPSWIEGFFHALPAWAVEHEPTSTAAVAVFLRHLRGKTPIAHIAELAQRNRYSVARWLAGSAEPKLPDFLLLVDVMSRRLPDLVATLTDPARLPSLRRRWQQLQLARRARYELPWSHAVLRALELQGLPGKATSQRAWIARQLGIGVEEVREALGVLEGAGLVAKTARGYRLREVTTVDTGQDPEAARALKVAWLETALQRLRTDAPGRFGYSVFAVSLADLARLHDGHLQYVRAMQEIIARSTPNECVGLYCSQHVNLAARGRAE